MHTVNIHEAKTHLSRLVEQAAAGAEIIIAKAGRPVARLMPLAAATRKPRKLGILAGKFTVPDDIDAMFAADIEGMFYGPAEAGHSLSRNSKDHPESFCRPVGGKSPSGEVGGVLESGSNQA